MTRIEYFLEGTCVPETSQSALKVLVVEDDKELAAFVRTGLEDEGFTVTLSFDGSSGMRQGEMHTFDIIVMDVMLPWMDGFEVTKRLRPAECENAHPAADGARCVRRYREGARCLEPVLDQLR